MIRYYLESGPKEDDTTRPMVINLTEMDLKVKEYEGRLAKLELESNNPRKKTVQKRRKKTK